MNRLLSDGKVFALTGAAAHPTQHSDARTPCAEVEASQRLESGFGSQFDLADRYEQAGRTASAWVLFKDLESAAERDGQAARAVAARDRAAALEPKVVHVEVEVPPRTRLLGLSVRLDGVPVGDVPWRQSIPVDPGVHRVLVSAAGKKPRQTELTVLADGNTQTVTIPPLEDSSVPRRTAQNSERPRSHAQRTASYVSFGLGGVSAIVGTVFGLRTVSKYNQAVALASCDRGDRACAQRGASLRTEQRHAGTVSTVAFVVSGAALATGLILLLSEEKAGTSAGIQLAAGASLTPSDAALSLRAVW